MRLKLNFKYFLFFIFFIFVSFVYLYYGAFTSSWGFGDETYYYLAAKRIVNNEWKIDFIDKLYATGKLIGKGEWLGKPPLSYYIPAIFYWIGNGDLTVYKLFTPVFAILTILLIFLVGKKFFNFETGFIAAVIAAGTPLFIHFSLITYFEPLNAFMLLLVFYTSFEALEKKTTKSTLLAGSIFSFFIKEISFFIPIFFILFLLISKLLNKFDKRYFKILFLISLIGILLYSPWLIRNYTFLKNPVYPNFMNLFSREMLDEEGIKVRESAGGATLANIFSIGTLVSYFGLTVFILLGFGLGFLLVKMDKLDIWVLSFLITFLIPIILSPDMRDIRYIFPEIIIFSLAIAAFISYFLKELKGKYLKYLPLIIVILITVNSLNTIYSEANRIDTFTRHPFTGYEDAYKWIDENTPNNSVLMDLFSVNCVYYTDRICTFPHIVNSGELWNFWKLSESDALEVLKRENINYVVVDADLFNAPKGSVWIAFPLEFAYTVNTWKSFNMSYNNGHILIYKIEYPVEKEFENEPPVFKGQIIDSTKMRRPADITIKGNYAYVSTLGGASIVDVSNVGNPKIIGNQQDFENISDMVVNALSSDSRFLYTVSFDKSNLVVIDVSDKTKPQTVSVLKEFSKPVAIHWCGGSEICITDWGNNSFYVVDVSDPYKPQIIGSLKSDTLFYQPQNFAVKDKYVYTSLGGGNGLTVIDIADLKNPKIVGYVNNDTTMRASDFVCIQNNYAYVLSWGTIKNFEYHLNIVDVSDPNNPTLASYLTLDKLPSGINCMGKYIVFEGLDVPSNAYADIGGKGYLEVVDVSDPKNPQLAFEWYHPALDNNYFAVVQGKYLYLTQRANNTNGFVILELPSWLSNQI